MSHVVQVVWVNANGPHGLLPDKHTQIVLDVDGTVVPATTSAAGKRKFVVPAGAKKVTLHAAFSAEFGPVKGRAPAMIETVLQAQQEFDVTLNGTALQPVGIPAFGGGPHPLVDTKSASGAAGATVIRIHTEFVDISKFWTAYASRTGEYAADHVAGTTLVPLGFTGGTPRIWFASVADAAASSSKAEVSCLLFCRPSNYTYTKIDQKHHMNGLNRYLLRPTTDPNAPIHKREKFMLEPDGKPYVWVRAGFEHAMTQSGKAIVMLHPWPSGASFGSAATKRMPNLAGAAIRFLWGRGNVGAQVAGVRLGRLGVSGYSAGGLGLWGAFANNVSRISEVYAFDAVNTSTHAGGVSAWFRAQTKAGANPCLRMGSGNSIATHVGIRRTIEQAMGGPQPGVTVIPDSAKDYAKGANPIWDETTAAVPSAQNRRGFWHQFAVFGAMGTPPLTGVPNFMEQFLTNSGF